jgi:hypothetical protein
MVATGTCEKSVEAQTIDSIWSQRPDLSRGPTDYESRPEQTQKKSEELPDNKNNDLPES